MEKIIFLSAGEYSADLWGADLLRELSLPAFGVGGENLKKQGLQVLYPMEEIQWGGVFELLPKLPRIKRVLKTLTEAIIQRRPSALVLIDLPDFHFMLAERVKKRVNIPVIHYVSPTVWAWRPGRIKRVKKLVDLELLIYPFEREIYRRWNIPHCFVGHPGMERVKPEISREEFSRIYGSENFVTILPGSRPMEIKNHMPTLLKFVRLFRKRNPQIKVLLAVAPTVKEMLMEYPMEGIIPVEEHRYSAMAYAKVVLSASGTATLETAFLQTPLIVFYKLLPLTYFVLKPLVKLEKYSIVNILAGREVAKELFQGEFTPENLVRETEKILGHRELQEEIRGEFSRIREMFPKAPASKIAAKAILTLLEEGPGKLDEVCRETGIA